MIIIINIVIMIENVISGIKPNYKSYNKKLRHDGKKSIRW